MTDLTEVRKRAWATRRAKYGERGHAGAYSRLAPADHAALTRCRRVIARLVNEGLLSEGQGAKATGLYRIDLRILCDEMANTDAKY